MGVCVYAANQHLHSLYTDSEETRHIPLLYLQTNRWQSHFPSRPPTVSKYLKSKKQLATRGSAEMTSANIFYKVKHQRLGVFGGLTWLLAPQKKQI